MTQDPSYRAPNNYGLSSGHSADKTGATPDPRETIHRLRQLKQQFNNSAQDYQRMANAVGDALTLLETAENDKVKAQQVAEELATHQRAALLAGMLMAAGKKGEFVFLSDASGSMAGTPMTAALDAVSAARKAGGMAKLKPAAFGLFGGEKSYWVAGDITPELRARLARSLDYASDFAPAVPDMQKIAADNRQSRKNTHFMVISDGDIFDLKAAKTAIELLLAGNSRVTIDFLIMGPKGTQMDRMADSIIENFPGRVRKHKPDAPYSSTLLSAQLQAKVVDAMAERLREDAAPRKKPAAPKP